MSLLEIRIGAGVLALLALLTLRRQRWAYFAFVVLGLLYFPAQNHFRVHVPKFDLLIPTMQVLVVSLRNYVYVALFAGMYWMSWVQFRRTDARILWAVLATLVVAALVEIAEGMTGREASRVRDLAPAVAGMLGAALVLALWSRLTRKPGYVRLVKKTVAPSKAARAVVPPPPPPQPLRGLPMVPTARVVPPPPDFSPTPAEPTEEVAPVRASGPRPEIAQQVVQRLRVIWQRVLAMVQRLWVVIRGRRRAIVIGGAVLVLVGAAAFAFVLLLPSPPPTTVAEQPKAAPPPPPRPLQSQAEGYYEPSYQFTVADRRFTRLTLRPEAFVTFRRVGTRQEAGCADARVGNDAVHLRCELDRVGMVTIDGRFGSRFVTSRLDAPVLTALITVTNPRGEVLYRARDSFRWHAPD